MAAALRVSSVYEEYCCRYLCCWATWNWDPMLEPRKRGFDTVAENSMLFWDPSSAVMLMSSALPKLFVNPRVKSSEPVQHSLSAIIPFPSV